MQGRGALFLMVGILALLLFDNDHSSPPSEHRKSCEWSGVCLLSFILPLSRRSTQKSGLPHHLLAAVFHGSARSQGTIKCSKRSLIIIEGEKTNLCKQQVDYMYKFCI